MSSSHSLSALGVQQPLILPSILMCDFGQLADEVARLEAAGAQALHLDVMDGHFVPNLSYGLPLVATFRRLTSLPLDVHLMIGNPQQHNYLARYREAGADALTIHVEAVADPAPLLSEIRRQGALAGLAINPATPITAVVPYLDQVDSVLVMSVMPGFGGQSFDPAAIDKLRFLQSRAPESVRRSVDGGVNPATIGACAAAGAQWFVVGSALFYQPDYAASLCHLTELARPPRSSITP